MNADDFCGSCKRPLARAVGGWDWLETHSDNCEGGEYCGSDVCWEDDPTGGMCFWGEEAGDHGTLMARASGKAHCVISDEGTVLQARVDLMMREVERVLVQLPHECDRDHTPCGFCILCVRTKIKDLGGVRA